MRVGREGLFSFAVLYMQVPRAQRQLTRSFRIVIMSGANGLLYCFGTCNPLLSFVIPREARDLQSLISITPYPVPYHDAW